MSIQTKTMTVKSDTSLAETTTTIRDTVTFDVSNMPNGITYKGLKAVLSFAEPIQWNKASTYDALTVVWDDASHGSYASKRPVPANIELTNEFYWLRTADLDAQVEMYRQEVRELDGRVTANSQAIDAETLRAETAEQTLRTSIETLNKIVDYKTFIKPEYFGAKGNGVDDDSAAFNKMFAYMEANPKGDSTYKNPYLVVLTGKYNLNGYEVPAKYFYNIVFFNGSIIGTITFPPKSFNNVTFINTQFTAPSINDYSLIMKPLDTLEYKTVSFIRCEFYTNGINIDSRSINVIFDSCAFHALPCVLRSGDIDKCTFKSCWIEVNNRKVNNRFIDINGKNESALTIDSCIVVNAGSTNDYEYQAIVSTYGVVNIINTRLSNEGSASYLYSVEVKEGTQYKLPSGHVSSVNITNCDNQQEFVYLAGTPAQINITNCSSTSGSIGYSDLSAIKEYLKINIEGSITDYSSSSVRYGFSPSTESGINVSVPNIVPNELSQFLNKSPYRVKKEKGNKFYNVDNPTLTDFELYQFGDFNNYAAKRFIGPIAVFIDNDAIDLLTIKVGTTEVTKKTIIGESNLTYTASVESDVITIKCSGSAYRVYAKSIEAQFD